RLDAAGSGIRVIHGAAGVGKTALAVHWAHHAADRYPDGQLFLNLRGHHPRSDPVQPDEALGHLLRSLGVPPQQLPPGVDEQARLFRSTLAGTRTMLVLDDAISADQV